MKNSGISMQKDNSKNSTVLLNQYKNDGFFDFYYSKDLKQVMKILNEVMDDG